jgi:putative colanic acid biosysnthesis UDP-glucose lipid carrier transferase
VNSMKSSKKKLPTEARKISMNKILQLDLEGGGSNRSATADEQAVELQAVEEQPIESEKPTEPFNRRSMLPPLSATTVASIMALTDTVALLAAGFVTYDRVVVYSPLENYYWTAVIFVWLVTLSLLNFGRLYRYEVAVAPTASFKLFVVVVLTAFMFLLAAVFSLDLVEPLSRRWVITFAGTGLVSLSLLRVGFSVLLRRANVLEATKRSMAVIGAGEQARRLLEAVRPRSIQPIQITGIYSEDCGSEAEFRKRLAPSTSVKLSGNVETLIKQARLGQIDDVLIALPWFEEKKIMELLEKLNELPVNVYLVSDLIGFRTEFKSPPSHFGNLPILQVVGKPMSGWDAVIKAVEDYFIAIIVFILLAPIMALIALLVKLDSPGPVIFRQKRLGFNNQIFDVYKFRTMSNQPAGVATTVQAKRDDKRVTRVGKFLRRSSLDELPQIFNVLNGTMSIVGPRPHALDHNEEFAKRTKSYFARHRVKPGITGLAQVKGFRGETDTTEKLEGRIRNDNFYAENWSLSLDIWILIRTLAITLSGKNAY